MVYFDFVMTGHPPFVTQQRIEGRAGSQRCGSDSVNIIPICSHHHHNVTTFAQTKRSWQKNGDAGYKRSSSIILKS